jgi:hypothetical protein
MEAKLEDFREKQINHTDKQKWARKRSEKYSNPNDHSHLRTINLQQLNIEFTPNQK